MRKAYFTVLTVLCVAFSYVFALSQSGGTFVIKESVNASGGGRGSGGTFTLDGTSGESVAGTTSAGGGFLLSGGFWGGAAEHSHSRTI